MHAVKVPLEFQNLDSAGVRPGEPDRRHRRLGTRVREAHEFRAWNQIHQAGGQPRLVWCFRAVNHARVQRCLDCLSNRRVVVAEHRRAIGAPEVEIAAAVRRRKPSAVAARRQHRPAECRVDARRAGRAAYQHLRRIPKMLIGRGAAFDRPGARRRLRHVQNSAHSDRSQRRLSTTHASGSYSGIVGISRQFWRPSGSGASAWRTPRISCTATSPDPIGV